MAQQDKTDWYWNGELAGAVNNLYYDLINVDVCHVPYATNHRNSSFFLKTRLAYSISKVWNRRQMDGYEVTDIKIIWNDDCHNERGTVYVMGRKDGNIKQIFVSDFQDGCIGNFKAITSPMTQSSGCGNWKMFITDFVKGIKYDKVNDFNDIFVDNNTSVTPVTGVMTGIQINEYNLGTQVGLFTDENVKNGRYRFKNPGSEALAIGNYILVYRSKNLDDSGHAGQVRMITGFDNEGRIVVDAPWLGFQIPEEGKKQEGGGLSYAFFTDWGDVIGFTNDRDVELLYGGVTDEYLPVYNQGGTSASARGEIIGVASTSSKVFVLTDNGYIHYSKEGKGYNKFFIDEDMFAGPDKMALASYKDMILAFGRKHIALGVPDEEDTFRTMYDQSQTIGLWSRYSFTEYEGDLVFVSNDKRLLMLTIASTGRYGLTLEDVGSSMMINGKLSTLRPGDEVYIGADDNNLRIFCNVSYEPYIGKNGRADIRERAHPISTHIYKFDTLFKVWTEDHIEGHLIWGASEGVHYGEDGIYVRDDAKLDCGDSEFETVINAYLIENESDWSGGSSSRLANRPKLFNTAKLNRIITTLGPGVYSNASKIRVTSYSKGIGYTYEFPISGDGNDWIGLITSYYLNEELLPEDTEKLQCLLSTIQDNQKIYHNNCSEGTAYRQFIAQNIPWCEDYDELITESHGICINDKIYELAPTMPLVTSIGENQDYCTQIKIELIGGSGDIICFGGRLAEMFIAPLFSVGPDGEYQLQPETDCD